MKNIYSIWQFKYCTVLSTILLLVLSTNAIAQVEKTFTQRTSTQALQQYVKDGSNGKVYNLRGDFKMAGNTNLTLTNYSDTGSNSDDMSYVDIDFDGSTINSSSSFLDITNDACNEIVYAGLYWSGRAESGNMSFAVTGNAEVPATITTQTLNHTHSGTNNLNNTTVTISRAGNNNAYYPVQLVKIGDKEFEFTINNDGTISKRERVNNGTWSAAMAVPASVISNLASSTSYNYTDVDTNTVETGTGNSRVQTRTETSTATQTDLTTGYKTYTLTTPIVYTYNGVNYTISVLRSYYTESKTRTTTATRVQSRNRGFFGWNSWSSYSAYSYGSWSVYTAVQYNGIQNQFRDAANNYVTIQGPKSSTTTVPYSGTLSKNIVKFKKENGTYQTVIAETTDIRYPSGGTNGNMYAAYADVTAYVRANKGGNYFVADLATTAGDDTSGTGYYGGWGLVVIYANPNMKWRDITVFDGYAYVAGSTTVSHQLPISGFTAAQSGDINVDIGVMAGEGDRSISGDYLQVLGRGGTSTNTNHYRSLGNSTLTGGFFNSNVDTGSAKNPNLVNNTGLDIQRISLPNQTSVYSGQTGTSNFIIGNNATSTTFRYGSTQDTYIIYNLVFAVDAYVPEVEAVNQVLTSQTTADINNLQPGDEITYSLDVYNYGSDVIDNGKIEVNIPPAMKLVSYSMQPNTQTASGANAAFNFSEPEWINPSTNTTSSVQPASADGGILRWTLGTIPTQVVVPNLANRVPMARLTYKLKVTDNCVILRSSVDECTVNPEINGVITGVGRNSGENLSTEFIKAYNIDCNNTPIYGGIEMQIKPSAAFLADCSEQLPMQNGVVLFKKFCQATNNVISRAEIMGVNNENYPAGTIFYSEIPTVTNPTIVSGDFPVNTNGSLTYYYAVTPGSNTACYLKLATQLEIITTQPTTNNVVVCEGEVITLNNIPSATFTLYYFQNENDSTPMLNPPAPTAPGTYTYWVADGQTSGTTNCFGPKKSFTITINSKPAVAVLTEQEICAGTNYTSSLTTVSGITKVWEYQLGNGSWVTLSNQLPGVSVVNNQLNIIGAQLALNDTKFRVKYTSTTTTCVNYSNEMVLKIKGCSMKVNPQIYNKFKQP